MNRPASERGLLRPCVQSQADALVERGRCAGQVLDIEALRRHHALTRDVWAGRFDQRRARTRALVPRRFDARFRRIRRNCPLGCAEMGRSPAGCMHLFQVAFGKGKVARAGHPMSRAHLHAAA